MIRYRYESSCRTNFAFCLEFTSSKFKTWIFILQCVCKFALSFRHIGTAYKINLTKVHERHRRTDTSSTHIHTTTSNKRTEMAKSEAFGSLHLQPHQQQKTENGYGQTGCLNLNKKTRS